MNDKIIQNKDVKLTGSTRPGLLLVFEGLDGAGKSTQVKMLAKHLEEKGHQVVVTNWNSGKIIGRAIKRAKKAQLLTSNCFSALHAADFFNRMENIIIPSLNAGKIVIADRYTYTALARDEARGLDSQWVKRIYSLAIEPDAAFLCRIPVEVALGRSMKKNGNVPKYYESGMDVSGRTDPAESFKAFQDRVAGVYDRMAEEGVLVPIDMNRGEEEIFASLLEKVEPIVEAAFSKPAKSRKVGIPLESGCFCVDRSGLSDFEGEFLSRLPKHILPGRLVVVEGAYHAGVTNQINVLYDWLEVGGFDVVKAGIGETWITTEIADRAAPKNALSPRTNVLLTVSEIAYIIETEVLPALRRGAIVLLNRYYITAMIGGLLRGMDKEWLIETLRGFAIQPDVTIYIDSPYELLLERADLSSLLAIESLNTGLDIGFTRDVETSYEFYQRSALLAYSAIAAADGLPTVDGSAERAEITSAITAIVGSSVCVDFEEASRDEVLQEVLELYHQHNGYFEHAQKVRQFAVQIFDATADLHGLGPRARRLLEFSALLHDIGRSMGKGHERHSYDLILDYKFRKLAKWEKRIIALVALYHNGSAENVDYSRQWRLRSEEQFAVRRLAGILRLADALDSSDKQAVTKLRISRELGAVVIDINSVDRAKEERKEVLEKKDLFEREFGVAVLVDRNRIERFKLKGCKAKREGLFL